MARPQTDLHRLQGVWHIARFDSAGTAIPAAALNAAEIHVTGDRFLSTGMGQDYEGRFVLEATRTPKHIDLTFTSGPQNGTRNLGIYRLDRDRWTLCLSMQGGARPRKFAANGDGIVLEVLVRETLKPPSPQAPKPSSPQASKPSGPRALKPSSPQASEIDGEWVMQSAVFDGKPMAQEMVQFCRRTTGGGETKVLAGGQVMLHASFALDRSVTPVSIDYVNLAGAQKGKKQAGIMSLDGDVLKVCMSAPGDARPKDFTSKPGDKRSLTVWRRS